MSQGLTEYQFAVQSLKAVLKAQRITYRELAKRVGLSESGLKKILGGRDGSFQRLASLCKEVGVSISELLEAQREKLLPITFTEEQQSFFLSQPLAFELFWKIVYERMPPEKAQLSMHLESQDALRIYRQLDKLNLLPLLPGDRVRVPALKQIKWSGDGPLIRKLYREWSLRLVESLARPDLPADKLFIIRYFKMKPKTYQDFLYALRELEEEFLRRTIQDMKSEASDLADVRWVAAADNRSFFV